MLNQRITIILSSSLLALLLLSAFVSQPALQYASALPGGRMYDEGHDSGYIDWAGSVGYASIMHRDAICPGTCSDTVTSISGGSQVSGAFNRDVGSFDVLVAIVSGQGYGTATLTACSATTSQSLNTGNGSTPGYIKILMTVPAGCRDWSLSSSGGVVYFAAVDVTYSGPANQPPVISGSLNCSQPGNSGWCRNNARLALTASDPQGYALTITGNAGSVPISCNGSCTINLPPGSGTATYTVTAATSGLTTSGNTTWKYDPNPPVSNVNVNGTSGSNGWYISTVNVLASGSDAISGLASTGIAVDGGAVVGSAILTDGVHSVTATTLDVAGNSSSITMTISVDTTPPMSDMNISGTSGSNGWYVSTVDASPSGSDTVSGLASATLSVDGGMAVGSATLTDGVHSVTATSLDVAGNTSSKTLTISVDTLPPDIFVSATGNQAQDGWFTTAVDLSATASDATSGVTGSVSLSFDNGTTWVNGLNTLYDGRYDVIFSVMDFAGNTATSQMSLKIDMQPPYITLSEAGRLGQNGWYVSSATISAEVSDNLSGVASTQYRVDGGAWQEGDFVTVEEGIHTIDFQAFDAAGNNAQISSQEIHVDLTPPAYNFDSALNGSVFSGTVTLGGTASDETSGVNAVTFSLDGTMWIAAAFADPRWNISWDSAVFDNGNRDLYLRATDLAGNTGEPIRASIILDNFPPYVELAETWNIWESGVLVVLNNVIPLKNVKIVVQDPLLRYPDRVLYDDLPAPKVVTWDRVIGPASAPPGSYTASVQACDIYGLCSNDPGTILIPVVTAPVPFQLPVIEIPKWFPPISFLPAPEPAPEQPIAVPAAVLPIRAEVQAVPFPIWIIFVIGGLLLLFAFLLLLDPRPKAWRSLTHRLTDSMMSNE